MIHDPVFRRRWRSKLPVVDRAEGIYIYDVDGNKYIDGIGGSYVVSIGHGVKEVAEAMAAQASRVAFPFVGTFGSQAEIDLARMVLEMAPPGMSKVYFTSGGSEANEVAIKLARKYQLVKGRPERWRVIGRWQSYHGATVGAMSATGHVGRRSDFAPYMLDFPHIPPPYCYRCPFGLDEDNCGLACARELERTIHLENSDTIAAFISEPVIGAAAGAVPAPGGYYEEIRDICDRHDILMICDEVITGFGRTGSNFGIDHYGVSPDIITCGKGLGSGYAPLGAVIVHEKVIKAFEASGADSVFTGYTYSGNPVACATGVAVLTYLKEHNLIERAREEGQWFLEQLEQLRRHPSVGDVRGKGLLAAVEFVADRETKAPFDPKLQFAKQVQERCRARGLIIASEQGTVDGIAGDYVLLAPPFIATREEMSQMIEILSQAIAEVEAAA